MAARRLLPRWAGSLRPVRERGTRTAGKRHRGEAGMSQTGPGGAGAGGQGIGTGGRGTEGDADPGAKGPRGAGTKDRRTGSTGTGRRRDQRGTRTECGGIRHRHRAKRGCGWRRAGAPRARLTLPPCQVSSAAAATGAYPKRVKVVEVGPRDGLQNEKVPAAPCASRGCFQPHPPNAPLCPPVGRGSFKCCFFDVENLLPPFSFQWWKSLLWK